MQEDENMPDPRKGDLGSIRSSGGGSSEGGQPLKPRVLGVGQKGEGIMGYFTALYATTYPEYEDILKVLDDAHKNGVIGEYIDARQLLEGMDDSDAIRLFELFEKMVDDGVLELGKILREPNGGKILTNTFNAQKDGKWPYRIKCPDGTKVLTRKLKDDTAFRHLNS